MKHDDCGLEPELMAFLTPGSIERRAPANLRARALANARAIMAAGGTIAAAAAGPVKLPKPVPFVRRRRPFRVALLASTMMAVGAVGAVAALYNRSSQGPQMALSARPAAVPAGHETHVAPGESREPVPAALERAVSPSKPSRPVRAGGDSVAVELALLQRAHAAYTRRDFSGALLVVGEHARRFPRGHLAEQREALRVHSLIGSGHTDEAHRASAAFAVRFPRSVLLQRLEGGPEAPE